MDKAFASMWIHSKTCLVEGIDELGWILKQEPAIAAYEQTRTSTLNTLLTQPAG